MNVTDPQRRGPRAAIASPLPTATILAYTLAVWPLTTAQLSLPFIAPYYSQTFGFSVAFVGFVLTLGRLLDVGADVAVAWASDQTRTRWGRRKPWVVAGLVIYVPACLWLFVPPSAVSSTRYVGSVMLYFTAWTMAFIPYLSQGTELSDDYRQKNRINVTLSAVMLIALLSAFTLPLLLIDPKAAFVRSSIASAISGLVPAGVTAFLRAPSPTGRAYFGSSMLVITALSLAPLLATLPGYLWNVREVHLAEHVRRGSLTSAFRNPVFMRFALGYVLIMAGYMGRGGLMPIILTYALHLPDSYLFYMMLMFLSSLVVTPLWSRLLLRFERTTCCILAALLESAGLATLCLIPDHSTGLAALAFVVMGLPGQTLILVPFLIAADASDYSRWKTHADSRALHVSLVSLITKLGTVFGGVTVWLAGAAGLDLHRGEQPIAMVHLLKLIGLGLPVLCLVAGSAIIVGFPLTRRRHAILRSRLDRREAAGG